MGNKLATTSNGNLNENLNLKSRRAKSITWSFRYSSLKKRMPSAEVLSQPHLDINKWLEFLDLKQYEENFEKFSGVEKLLELNEADIKELGIKNSAHRARIVSNLVALRDKYRKFHKNGRNEEIEITTGTTKTTTIENMKFPSSPNQRHSIATVDTCGNSLNLHYKNQNCYQHQSSMDNNKVDDDRSSICKSNRNINNNINKNDGNDNSSIYEILDATSKSKQKQSKSCGNLILNMDSTTTSTTSSTITTPEAQQEAIALKKALEWELSLDSRDLRSHAWYHGGIPRQRAEEIVQKEGDFLIRDCASQPGNYVLTCRTKTSVLHFVINKVLIQPETVYERVQYQFEDDAYDTVPDLITFYVGSGKPISVASGARIQFPCNRTYPLSFYGNKFIGSNHHQYQQHQQIIMAGMRGVSPLLNISSSLSLNNSTNNIGTRFTPYNNQQGNYNSYRSPVSSPPRTKRETPPRLPSKKQRSQSLTPVQATISSSTHNTDKYCSADGVIQQNSLSSTPDNTNGLPTHPNEGRKLISSTAEKCSSADGLIQQIQQNGSIKEIMVRSSDEKSTSADGVITHSTTTTQVMSKSTGDSMTNIKLSSHSTVPRTSSGNLRLSSSRASSLNRDTSESSLSPCIEQSNFTENDSSKPPSPPPKPARIPLSKEKYTKDQNVDQQHPLNRVASYHASGSDSGNGSGDSAQSSTTGDGIEPVQHRGVVIRNPRFMTNSASSITLKSFSDFDVVTAEQELASMEIPIIEQVSKFDLENFHTLLLPAVENKPLDNSALNTIRMMLAETGPRIIAQHLTLIDIKLILGDEEDTEEKNILDCCGLELITLPHGQTFRQDLIERTQCLKLLVAVTILTCPSDLERAKTLNKWIQVAVDTKTALGNLFGFCAIMLGLCMPQIQKLDPTWHILRQEFTDSAFTFEAKLRPTLKTMNDCSNPQAPNTTIPHLLPYILLKDRGMDDILTTLNQQQSTLISSCISPWEINADDFGISILFSHLDSIRGFTKNLPLYKRNAHIVIEDSNPRFDSLLSDAFRTEFHMKFLWGSKGATSAAEFRHSKLEQILTLMAEKFCNGDQIGYAG